MEIRILGLIAEQTEEAKTERNDRLLGVAVHSYDFGFQIGTEVAAKTRSRI